MELTQTAVWDHKSKQPHTKHKAFQDEPNKPESEESKYSNRNETQNVDPLKWFVWKWSTVSKSRWFNKNIFINQSKTYFQRQASLSDYSEAGFHPSLYTS